MNWIMGLQLKDYKRVWIYGRVVDIHQRDLEHQVGELTNRVQMQSVIILNGLQDMKNTTK